MSIDNHQKGFVSLLAMVVFVGVVGGGVILSSATIKNVAEKECEGHISAWQSGEIYDDIASNKEGAIEKAQKCQEAVNKATKVAKANAALLGRASNIGSNGAEVIATELVNVTMDYIEDASDPEYKPLQKNNKLPEDIETKEESDITEKIDSFLKDEKEKSLKTDDSEGSDIVNNLSKEEEDNETETNNSDSDNNIISDCKIDIPEGPEPRVLAMCDSAKMGFWYADKDGDIENISVRFRFSYPEFDGYQEFDWQTAKFESDGNPYCDFQPAIKFDHPSVPAGYKAVIDIDIMLEDSKGNKSNISSCTI